MKLVERGMHALLGSLLRLALQALAVALLQQRRAVGRRGTWKAGSKQIKTAKFKQEPFHSLLPIAASTHVSVQRGSSIAVS